MANDKINVNMFGTFSLSRGNVTVDLTKLLGKQLINLFQLLLLQKGVVISKNNIIDILYPDSEIQIVWLSFLFLDFVKI